MNMPQAKAATPVSFTAGAQGRRMSPDGGLRLSNAAPGQWACSPAPIPRHIRMLVAASYGAVIGCAISHFFFQH